MIVAAHQPCYLPWLGYFDTIARSDMFVLLDHVQFERQNYQNRNRFKLAGGTRWLTVPVLHGGLQERICDKRILNGEGTHADWQRRTWLTLAQSYKRAPFFSRYEEELRDVLLRPWEKLVDLDLALLALCMRWLEIHTPTVRSSSLAVEGKRTQLIVSLCQRLGATTYLSGAGGSKDYLDRDAFARAGIRLSWQEFRHPIYPQLHPEHGFTSHLSVLDLILNCGPKSRAILLGPPETTPAVGVAS
jgi:hypothetical protein